MALLARQLMLVGVVALISGCGPLSKSFFRSEEAKDPGAAEEDDEDDSSDIDGGESASVTGQFLADIYEVPQLKQLMPPGWDPLVLDVRNVDESPLDDDAAVYLRVYLKGGGSYITDAATRTNPNLFVTALPSDLRLDQVLSYRVVVEIDHAKQEVEPTTPNKELPAEIEEQIADALRAAAAEDAQVPFPAGITYEVPAVDPDSEAPLAPLVAGDGGRLSITTRSDSADIQWSPANDGAGVNRYVVVYSKNQIASLTEIEESQDAVALDTWSAGIASATVSGLEAGVTYRFNVVVDDGLGNRIVYNEEVRETDHFSGGGGTPGDPYIVTNLAELRHIADDEDFLDKHFRLDVDIDASETLLRPFVGIGTQSLPFTGTFDGNHRHITNFVSSDGLFTHAEGPNFVLKNLGIVNAVVTSSSSHVGILVGTLNGGTIETSFVTGAIRAAAETGALVGVNGGTVSDCYAEVAVVGDGDNVGGLVGDNRTGSTLQRSYFKGSVSQVAGRNNAGGIVGRNSGELTDSFVVAIVTGGEPASEGVQVGSNMGGAIVNNSQYLKLASSSMVGIGGDSGPSTKDNFLAFTDPNEPVLKYWDFIGGVWIIPQSGGLPVLGWQAPNETVTFAPEFSIDHKVGASDDNQYRLYGYCSRSGATIVVDVSDGLNPMATATDECEGEWRVDLDLSTLNDGDLFAVVTELGVDGTPSTDSISLKKDTSVCGAGSPNNPNGFTGVGDGSTNSPHQICTYDQLLTVPAFPSKSFILMDNILLDPLIPVNPISQLSGTFDGNGFAIRNLTIANGGSPQQGLFASITPGSIVRNLFLTDVDVVGADYTGALAGLSDGLIQNVFARGRVIGRGFTGGLVGESTGTVVNAHVFGTVQSTNEPVGGVLGKGASTSASDAQTFVSGTGAAGGLIGTLVEGDVVDSSASGDVFVTGDAGSVGGLVGESIGGGEIRRARATGTIVFSPNAYQSTTTAVGGIVGALKLSGQVTGSHGDVRIHANSQALRADGARLRVGGIVGMTGVATISQSASAAMIFSVNDSVGGIMGEGNSSITDCIFSGMLVQQSNRENAGMIAGLLLGGGNVDHCEGNGRVVAGATVGGLVGRAAAATSILRSRVNGVVNGARLGGGLVGWLGGGSLLSSSFHGKIAAGTDVGGLAGVAADGATISDVAVEGSVVVQSQVFPVTIGGFLARAPGVGAPISLERAVMKASLSGGGGDDSLCGLAGAVLREGDSLKDIILVPVNNHCSSIASGTLVGDSNMAKIAGVYWVRGVSDRALTCGYSTNDVDAACISVSSVDAFTTRESPPLNAWDFENIWETTSGLPAIRWE